MKEESTDFEQNKFETKEHVFVELIFEKREQVFIAKCFCKSRVCRVQFGNDKREHVSIHIFYNMSAKIVNLFIIFGPSVLGCHKSQ